MQFPIAEEISMPKNTSGNDRRLNDLHVGLYNLLQQWDRENEHCCGLLENICQGRIQLMDLMEAKGRTGESGGGDFHRQMFISDATLRNSELLCASIPKFESFLQRLRKFGPKLNALNDLISSSTSSNLAMSSDDRQQLLQFRTKELVDLFPIILGMYEQELAFKRDSIEDLALFDDQDLFTVFISAWKHGIYIEPSIISLIYPL
uniref:Uncharacterized protein n=1 Tax=Globodera pallida TaxID=36090 RepID=A0A183BHN0_GLOPA